MFEILIFAYVIVSAVVIGLMMNDDEELNRKIKKIKKELGMDKPHSLDETRLENIEKRLHEAQGDILKLLVFKNKVENTPEYKAEQIQEKMQEVQKMIEDLEK